MWFGEVVFDDDGWMCSKATSLLDCFRNVLIEYLDGRKDGE